MLHARFVRTGELPADVALDKVDSFFPVICFDNGGKHDEGGFDDLISDRVVWVDNGEANVPMVRFVWNFRSRPIWFICKGHVFEEGVGVLDFFQELFFGPELTHVHGIAVEFFIGDRSTQDLSEDQFVPDCRFGKRNVGVTLGEDIDDGLGCVLNVFVL